MSPNRHLSPKNVTERSLIGNRLHGRCNFVESNRPQVCAAAGKPGGYRSRRRQREPNFDFEKGRADFLTYRGLVRRNHENPRFFRAFPLGRAIRTAPGMCLLHHMFRDKLATESAGLLPAATRIAETAARRTALRDPHEWPLTLLENKINDSLGLAKKISWNPIDKRAGA